jgi:hypothetical protein
LVVISNILSGLLIGLVFGIALQRGRFCFNSAFRDTLLFKDYSIIKAIGAAIAIEMVGFQLLSDLGLVRLHPRGLYWGADSKLPSMRMKDASGTTDANLCIDRCYGMNLRVLCVLITRYILPTCNP